MLPKVAEKLAPICEQIIERYNVKVRPLDKSRFVEEVKTFLSIYNRSLTNTWGFVPMSDAEIEHVAKSMKPLIVPELAVFVEIDGRTVGATFGLLDYNPRIKEIDGRLFPFGFIHLLRNKSAHQENSPDLHQRAARIPVARAGPGAHARRRAQGLGMGHRGSRVLLGSGVQQVFPRRACQGRRQDHQDLSHLRYGLRFRCGQGGAASEAPVVNSRAAGNPSGRIQPRSERLPEGALVDLCRRPAVGSTAAD